MKFKALCTDIDGTLLNENRELSSRTISAIKSISNIPVILASSRMPSAMRHIQRDLGILNHPLVCYNGGYVLHFPNKNKKTEILESVFIPASICAAIVSLAGGTEIHVSLYAEDEWYAPSHDKWTEREERITKVQANIIKLDPLLDEWLKNDSGAHKVMCMGPEHEIEDMQVLLQEKFGHEIHIYRSRPTYLEIAPKAISKASGLEHILKQIFSIELSEVIAFGDNYNDIELLQAVGLGIAVGNAREEVKQAAKEITFNSIEDGVAIAIEKYFLESVDKETQTPR